MCSPCWFAVVPPRFHQVSSRDRCPLPLPHPQIAAHSAKKKRVFDGHPATPKAASTIRAGAPSFPMKQRPPPLEVPELLLGVKGTSTQEKFSGLTTRPVSCTSPHCCLFRPYTDVHLLADGIVHANGTRTYMLPYTLIPCPHAAGGRYNCTPNFSVSS